MNIGSFFSIGVALLSVSLALVHPQRLQAQTGRHPDMVVFITDDHSHFDTEPYASPDMRTPHMQRLADGGMTFEYAFVPSPSCGPSRASLLTGLMPARHGAEPNQVKPDNDIKKWPAYFQELGYEVVAFGKVGHYGQTADYGFDSHAHIGFHDHRGIAAAANFIRNRDWAREKPLCLIVGSNWPHMPWPARPEGYDPDELFLPAGTIDTEKTREWRARYAAAVTRADNDLGVILDALDHAGQAPLMLFSSDHGSQWPFAKWNLYEAGLRVPLIVSWPGVVEPGSRTDAKVSWIDILPTLVEAADGPADTALDGRSFLPVLLGEEEEHRREIFATHSGDGNFNVYPMRSLRTSRWKYIRNLYPEYQFTTHIDLPGQPQHDYFSTWETAAQNDPDAAAILHRYHMRPAEELYDLSVDPHEERNLAADPEHAARLESMRDRVKDWMLENEDRGRVYGRPRLLSSDASWIGGEGSFHEGANWNTGAVPAEGMRAVISNGGIAVHSSGSTGLTAVIPGLDGAGALRITGGKLVNSGAVAIGHGPNATAGEPPANGILEMSGDGAFTAASFLRAGHEGGAEGRLILRDSASLTVAGNRLILGLRGIGYAEIHDQAVLTNAGTDVIIGDINGTGHVLQTGGIVRIETGELWIGQSADGVGTYVFEGGILNANNWISLGRTGGNGTFIMTGGTIQKTGPGHFSVGGVGQGARGTFTQSGGRIDLNESRFQIANANDAIGVATLSGDADLQAGTIVFAINSSNADGTINLDGGTLSTGRITGNFNSLSRPGTSRLNFNGTRIRATRNQPDFIERISRPDIREGGLHLDTNGYDITIAEAFPGVGGLTKSGEGRLTLTGNSTYAGPTRVGEGALVVHADLSAATGPVIVEEGATLEGSGTFGGEITIDPQADFSPSSNITVPSASIAGTLNFRVNGTDATRLTVTGALDIAGGGLAVTATGSGATADVYILASYSTLAGRFADISVPAGYSIDYAHNGNTIALVAGEAPPEEYGRWAARHGLDGHPAGGKSADANGDGISNFTAYALGLNPLKFGGMPTAVVDEEHLVLDYTRYRPATTTTAVIPVRTEALHVAWTRDGVEDLHLHYTGEIEYRRARTPVVASQGFLRLEITEIENRPPRFPFPDCTGVQEHSPGLR